MRGAREIEFGVREVVAEMDAAGVVSASGYPSLERLLEDPFRIDRRDARHLVRHAAALLPRVAPSGTALAPTAPATAAAAAEGAVGPAHVAVVLDALDHLGY